MKFILAPDSFKECMTAKEACIAMEKGIKRIMPGAICVHVPLADGGEGTLHTMVALTGGNIFQQKVKDPLGNETAGEYGILGDNETGVVELASASGLHLVDVDKRNPLITTTYGTGELIKAALAHGIKKLVIGIGGSATNDGGAGIAQALGVKFLDKDGNEIGFGGGELNKIESIDTSGLIAIDKDVEIEVACDVTNPLTGKNGAAYIYGPQKGATKEMVEVLDRNLEHYTEKIKVYLYKDVKDMEGAGAAGGAGAGLMAFLNAKKVRGIDIILKYYNLEEKIKDADYIFTGEGSIDHQVAFGKTISGVIDLAKKYNKPVIAFAGNVEDADALYKLGITSVFGILPSVSTLKEALEGAKENLENTVYAVTKLIGFATGSSH
ncbi:MAG TPA: glycerate kinase [Chitinophagaceae bacterium]|nr:glycerate kinase [Chitinophagaceae bacterium]